MASGLSAGVGIYLPVGASATISASYSSAQSFIMTIGLAMIALIGIFY